MRGANGQHIGAVLGERARRHRRGDDARQVEHAHALQRAQRRLRMANRRVRLGRCVADALDLEQGQGRNGDGLRVRLPFVRRANEGGAQAGRSEPRLQVSGLALRHRSGHGGAAVGATQHLQHALVVVREVGVELHPAVVGRLVIAEDRARFIPRRLAIDRQVAIAAEHRQRAPHADLDGLWPAAARLPDLRGGERLRGNRRGGHRADLEGRRQGAFGLGEAHAGQCFRLGFGQAPEVAHQLAGQCMRRHFAARPFNASSRLCAASFSAGAAISM